VIHDLSLHGPTRTLAAFTHGRSAYRATLPSAAAIRRSSGGAATAGVERPRWSAIAPNPLRLGDGTARLEYSAPAGTRVSIGIFDAAGRLRRQWPAESASGAVRFDGRDAAGKPLPVGVYFARLSGRGGTASLPLTILP
jgi:hypothetical protein